MEKQIFFLSGLPRSGSTVLSALLKQHPDVYVSPTSPLVEMVKAAEQAWRHLNTNFTMPYDDHLENLSKGMMYGYYGSVEKSYIFDKSRAWPPFSQGLTRVFQKPPKIICTVRSIDDILRSFYRLYPWGTDQPNHIEGQLFQRGIEDSGLNRLKIIWETMVKGSWDSLMNGFRNQASPLLIIEYEDLLHKKQEVMDSIYSYCEIEKVENDFENISVEKEEIDEKWGVPDLHTIRPKLEKKTYELTGVGKSDFDFYKNLNLEFWRS